MLDLALHLRRALREARKYFATIACALILIASSHADERAWSSFQNGGHSTLAADQLPLEWSTEKNLAWQADIPGYGQSTPIVAHDLVVVTSTSGSSKEHYHVIAYDAASGEQRWQVDIDNPTPYANTPMVSRAAPSAIATNQSFVAFFEGGVLLAISPQGKVQWKQDLVALHGPIDARHGLAASLEQDEERVFVWVERSEQPYVMALNKETGETMWKVPGVGATSWASPRLIPVAGGVHLVCSGSGKVVGYDRVTGKRQWDLNDISNNTSCTPMPVEEGLFLIGASDGRGETGTGDAAASNGLIEVTRQANGSYQAQFKWRATKATSTFGSPIVAGGSVIVVNRTGVLYRLDLHTGDQQDVVRTDAGGIWATPIVAGDYLYLFGYKGTTSVVRLSDSVQVATNRLWPAEEGASFGGGQILYAAAPAPPFLYLRSGARLFAVKQ